jgi:5'-nucleotidase/UDP-sugar diphosphatase
MGRETKLLLAVLAALTGAFVGVLSMKLLVPRPPAGTGPDVEVPHDFAAAQDLVEPPTLDRRGLPATAFAAAPDLVSSQPRDTEPPPARDPFVSRTRYEEPAGDLPRHEMTEPPAAADLVPPPPAADLLPPPAAFVPAPDARELRPEADQEPAVMMPPRFTAPQADSAPLPAAATLPTLAGSHVVQPGDSWWSLAERAYGDGRLYRALFAWNKALDPRVALTPGTQLEIPPEPRLQAAWPKLMPR